MQWSENRRDAVIWSGIAVLAIVSLFGWKYGRDYVASSQGKAAVAEQLIDPSSAMFRKVRVVRENGGAVVCGEINGKNHVGAYTGFRKFWAKGKQGMIQPTPGSGELQTLSWSIFADSCKE